MAVRVWTWGGERNGTAGTTSPVDESVDEVVDEVLDEGVLILMWDCSASVRGRRPAYMWVVCVATI